MLPFTGQAPAYYRWVARKSIGNYGTVTMTNGTITKIQPEQNNTFFTVTGTYAGDQEITYRARKVILGTGITDLIPGTPGLKENFGKGIYWCPWCDGHEHADQALGVVGPVKSAPGTVREVITLNTDIVAFTNGTAANQTMLDETEKSFPRWRDYLKAKNVSVDDRVLARVERLRDGADPSADPSLPTYPERDLFRLHFATGEPVLRNAFIINVPTDQASSLPRDTGVKIVDGKIDVDQTKGLVTSVPGVYAIGDANNAGATNIPFALFSGKRTAVFLHVQLERENTAALLAGIKETGTDGAIASRSMHEEARAMWDQVNGQLGDVLYAGEFDQVSCSRNSKAAAHVRRLDIELAHRQPTTTPVHIKDMAGILTCHLSRIPNLYDLRFNFDAPPRPSPFLAEARAQLTTALVTALRYVDLSNLRELDIYLPITYSFAQFFSNESTTSRTPIESVCRRLRHLGVGVRNWTSRTSPRHWVRDVLPEDARYPNEQYVENLFRLVEAAEDAESLSICCTNPLDFTGVSFPQRLESLHLSGVVLSSDDLASIFQKPTSMRAVQLFVVCLRAGTWKELLQPLSQRCPTTLVEFIAESCGYSSTGPSAHLYDALLPEPDNPSCIESRDYSDVLSLYLLQKKVIANQEIAKLPYCYEYDRAKRMDLKELILHKTSQRIIQDLTRTSNIFSTQQGLSKPNAQPVMMMHLLSLPDELLAEIVRYACRSERSNEEILHRQYEWKSLGRIATEILFQNLNVVCSPARWAVRHALRVSRSELGRHVRRLDLGANYNSDAAVLGRYNSHLNDGLHTMLRSLPLLHTLSITVKPASSLMGANLIRLLAAALQAVPLPNLKELDLYLPTTTDFVHFLAPQDPPTRVSITEVCGRLRHLGLRVDIETKPPVYRNGVMVPQDGKMPNSSGLVNLFTLAAASPNLDSLFIDGRNRLDLDGMAFSPHLTTIRLGDVQVSSATLSSIFSRASGLKHVHLYDVLLKDGEWNKVLSTLVKSSRGSLIEFSSTDCCYPGDEEEEDDDEGDLSTDEDGDGPATREVDDVRAVSELQQMAYRNRVALRLPGAFPDASIVTRSIRRKRKEDEKQTPHLRSGSPRYACTGQIRARRGQRGTLADDPHAA
ncbi:hypothetical protein PWT90_09149 [Aphanocladium album]|nr:hypothetical protein PWT90_09149 [Aphanocladium album]